VSSSRYDDFDKLFSIEILKDKYNLISKNKTQYKYKSKDNAIDTIRRKNNLLFDMVIPIYLYKKDNEFIFSIVPNLNSNNKDKKDLKLIKFNKLIDCIGFAYIQKNSILYYIRFNSDSTNDILRQIYITLMSNLSSYTSYYNSIIKDFKLYSKRYYYKLIEVDYNDNSVKVSKILSEKYSIRANVLENQLSIVYDDISELFLKFTYNQFIKNNLDSFMGKT
jgi:hypothetical protein